MSVRLDAILLVLRVAGTLHAAPLGFPCRLTPALLLAKPCAVGSGWYLTGEASDRWTKAIPSMGECALERSTHGAALSVRAPLLGHASCNV